MLFAKSQKAIIFFVTSVWLSVRMEQLGSHWIDFHEIWYLSFFEYLSGNFTSFVKSDKNNGYFTGRPIYVFLLYLAQFFIEWETFRPEVVEEIKKIFGKFIFWNRAVYEIIWKNIVEPDRPQMAKWRMRISCWIPRATNTHFQNM